MRPVAAVALAGGAVAAGFAARRLAQPAPPTAAAPTLADAPETAAAEATGVQQPRLAGARGHIPALEGLRGLAAIGIITTHVAFVTRMSYGTPVRRLYGRLDMLVAVFFAKETARSSLRHDRVLDNAHK